MAKSIIIIDDSESVRQQIVRTLEEVALFDRILQAEDGIQAFKLLLAEEIDLIICDLEMPRMDGGKLLNMIAAQEKLRDIPVIMLTGHEDREIKIKLLGQGASDYVTKPFDDGELVARIKVQLKIKSLQDDLKRSNELLKLLSDTDPLTHLFNRRYLMEMLGKELRRADRKGTLLSLILLDLDHFKRVNDIYGHQAGDRVLVAVAKLAAEGLRGYDFAARYGGEEFIIVLPETIHDNALLIAERTRLRIEQQTFGGQLKDLKTTASMGVATYPTDGSKSLEALIKAADEALYRAKTAGRNRVVSMYRK